MSKIIAQQFIDLHSCSTDQLLDQLSKIINDGALTKDRTHIYQVVGMILLAHSGDMRRRPDICTNHLLRVAIISASLFEYNTNILLLSLLHDIVEDYPQFLPIEISTNPQDIWLYFEKEYGKEFVDAMYLLTNPEEVEMEDRAIHEKYHNHLKSVFVNEDAFVTKLADFIDNLITVGISTSEKLKRECTPRYVPLVSEYQLRIKSLEKYIINTNFNSEEFFKECLGLYSQNENIDK